MRSPGERPPILEAVPNFSEGRASGTIRALAAAAGPVLLDRHSDRDHHRTVLTLAGSVETLRAAALALFEVARTRMDLRRHRGEHPRVGSLDVFPVVPLFGMPMGEAVALTRELAREYARQGIPVFLYGKAHRKGRPLPRIRRGGLTGLADRLARGRIRPDYGPRRLHRSAGAACFGARDILIAFNVNLGERPSGVARRIAKRIRSSGGGLPALRAIAVRKRLRNGEVPQVSMNLLDWHRTSISDAYAAVRDGARAAGSRIVSSEIVGLIPEAAAWQGMEEDLRLIRPARTIEDALGSGSSRPPERARPGAEGRTATTPSFRTDRC